MADWSTAAVRNRSSVAFQQLDDFPFLQAANAGARRSSRRNSEAESRYSSQYEDLPEDIREEMDAHLHGIAGSVLRQRMMPVMQRKKAIVSRKILTRNRQPQAFGGCVPKDVWSIITDSLLHRNPSHELQTALRKFPVETIIEALSPFVKPSCHRTGDVLTYPDEPPDSQCVYFVVQGTICLIPQQELWKPATQQYLKRVSPIDGLSRASITSITAPVSVPCPSGTVTLTAPCSFGIVEALQFKPNGACSLFAAPLQHTLATIVDLFKITFRDFQIALRTLSNIQASLRDGSALSGSSQAVGSDGDGNDASFAFSSGDEQPPPPLSPAALPPRRKTLQLGRRASKAADRSPSPMYQPKVATSASLSAGQRRTMREGKRELQHVIRVSRMSSLTSSFPLTEELLRLSWLFQSLPNHTLTDLVKNIRPMSVEAGYKLSVAGEKQRRWYFIRRGRCVVRPSTTISLSENRQAGVDTGDIIIEGGASIGELSLIFEEPRTNTVETMTCCDLWMLEHAVFAEIISSDETVHVTCQRKAAVLRAKWLAAQRRSSELRECLRNSSLFADCWSEVLYTLLIAAIEPMVLPQRTLIASAAEFCDQLLIVVKGTAASQRGDVPIQFGVGSIMGEACFVKHRWPFAIAATSIVDCWHLPASKLRLIAFQMDILQTLGHWDPDIERNKYLTRLNELHGGNFFPLETMGLLRQMLSAGVKDLVPPAPRTSRRACMPGERKHSYASHFRKVSLDELEVLCVSYPNSFKMEELLFRTSYGTYGDHLRAEFLRAKQDSNDGAAIISSSSTESSSSAAGRVDRQGPDKAHRGRRNRKDSSTSSEEDEAVVQANKLRRHAHRESLERKKVRRLLGEHGSSSSSSSVDEETRVAESNDVIDRVQKGMERYKKSRKQVRTSGARSAVLTHVDDGTVMNSAQLAVDQAVIKRAMREQRKRDVSSAPAPPSLVATATNVHFDRRISHSIMMNTSIQMGASMASHSMAISQSQVVPSQRQTSVALSDDDKASVGGGSSTAFDKGDQIAAPSGVYDWEKKLRKYFTADESVIPTLREMMKLLHARNKKIRRTKPSGGKGQSGDESSAASGGSQQASPVAGSPNRKKPRVVGPPQLTATVSDADLHLCVHVDDPEVTIGFPEHRFARHALAVSATARLGHYLRVENNLPTSPGRGKDGEADPAVEKTKMLWQLFKAAKPSLSNTGALQSCASASPVASDLRPRRKNHSVSLVTENLTPKDEPLTKSNFLGVPSYQGANTARQTEVQLPTFGDNSSLTPPMITLVAPATPTTVATSDANRGPHGKGTLHQSGTPWDDGALHAAARKQSTARRPSFMSSSKRVSNHFPNKSLFYEQMAKDLSSRLAVEPEAFFEDYHAKFRCSWFDEIAAGDTALGVQQIFRDFLERAKKHQAEALQQRNSVLGNRRQSMISRGSLGGSMLKISLEPASNQHSAQSGSPTRSFEPIDGMTTDPFLDMSLKVDATTVAYASDGNPASGSPISEKAMSNPSTPPSCTSPALSDVNWSDWDGYLQASMTRAAATPLPARRNVATKRSSVAHRRRGSMIAAHATPSSREEEWLHDFSDHSPAVSNASPSQSSASPTPAESPLEEEIEVLPEADPLALSKALPSAPHVIVFESQVVGEPPNVQAGSLKELTENIRSGQVTSDVEELLALATDDQVFTLYVDGAGEVPITEDPHSDPYAYDELGKLRRELRLAFRHEFQRLMPHRPTDDSDVRNKSRLSLRGSGGLNALNTTQAKRWVDIAQGDKSHGFPDAKESALILRGLEKMAEHISFGSNKQDEMAEENLTRTEALFLKNARNIIEDMNRDDDVVAVKGGKKAAVGGNGTDTVVRGDMMSGHCKVPWFLDGDAGTDHLTEALSETVVMPRRQQRGVKGLGGQGDGASDDDDTAHDDEEDTRERIVLVGSRQFNMVPHPLCRALPPLDELNGSTMFPEASQNSDSARRRGDQTQSSGPFVSNFDAFASFEPEVSPAKPKKPSLSYVLDEDGNVQIALPELDDDSDRLSLGGEDRPLDTPRFRQRSDDTSRHVAMEDAAAVLRRNLAKAPAQTFIKSTIATPSFDDVGKQEYSNAQKAAWRRYRRVTELIAEDSAKRRNSNVPSQQNAEDHKRTSPHPTRLLKTMCLLNLPAAPSTTNGAVATDQEGTTARAAPKYMKWKSLDIPLQSM